MTYNNQKFPDKESNFSMYQLVNRFLGRKSESKGPKTALHRMALHTMDALQCLIAEQGKNNLWAWLNSLQISLARAGFWKQRLLFAINEMHCRNNKTCDPLDPLSLKRSLNHSHDPLLLYVSALGDFPPHLLVEHRSPLRLWILWIPWIL